MIQYRVAHCSPIRPLRKTCVSHEEKEVKIWREGGAKSKSNL